MISALTIINTHNELPQSNPQDTSWTQIFDPHAAVKAVFNHVEKLASSRTTRHTARQYRICLYDFLEFCGAYIEQDQTDKTRMDGDYFDFSNMRMHTPTQVDEYIVHSMNIGRCSKTITKYLAVIRHYINALRKQPFLGISGSIRDLIHDCKEVFMLALDVDAPEEETKSTEQKGTRLTKSQVKEYAAAIDRDTLSGKRDAALFHTMLVSGLRVAEIARITLNSIQMGKSTWEIHVIGKRNNTDPAPFDNEGVALISEWVNAYNAGLSEDDPRRITPDTPIWQPLKVGDNYVSVEQFTPSSGLADDALRRIIKRRTPASLFEQIKRWVLPHDLRRTLAHNLNELNVLLTIIQRVLRHSSPKTTGDYIGTNIDMRSGVITNYWTDIWAA